MFAFLWSHSWFSGAVGGMLPDGNYLVLDDGSYLTLDDGTFLTLDT